MIIACALVVLLILASCEITEATPPPSVGSGYVDAVFEKTADKGDMFLACGAGGRLDRIYEDGIVENISIPLGDRDLTSILISEDIIIVAGASGAIAHSRDGIEFELSNGVGNEHILGLSQFNGQFYASTYSGKIFSSIDGISWKSNGEMSDKPLIAIAASSSYLMTITEDTDIFISKDGVNWDAQNYNTVYSGLAEPQSLSNIVSLNETMFVLGQLDNLDAPSVMYSFDGGQAWYYISSVELNNRPPEVFYPLTVYSVCFFGNNLMAACDRGRVLTFTDCPSCNEILDIKDVDMRCISVGNNVMLVAGDHYEYSLLSAEDLQNLSALAGNLDALV